MSEHVNLTLVDHPERDEDVGVGDIVLCDDGHWHYVTEVKSIHHTYKSWTGDGSYFTTELVFDEPYVSRRHHPISRIAAPILEALSKISVPSHPYRTEIDP